MHVPNVPNGSPKFKMTHAETGHPYDELKEKCDEFVDKFLLVNKKKHNLCNCEK